LEPRQRAIASRSAHPEVAVPALTPGDIGSVRVPEQVAVALAPDHVATDPVRALQDRLTFSHARELLVGLTGCTRERATSSLQLAAVALGIEDADLARRFLQGLEDRDDDDTGTLVVSLASAAQTAAADPYGANTDSAGGLSLPWAVEAGPRATPADAHVVVAVEGELDIATAVQLEAAVESTRPAGPGGSEDGGDVLLSLQGVTFVDLAGADGLASVHAAVLARGMSLRVTPPAAAGPRRLLLLATQRAWLAPVFTPGEDPGAPVSGLGA